MQKLNPLSVELWYLLLDNYGLNDLWPSVFALRISLTANVTYRRLSACLTFVSEDGLILPDPSHGSVLRRRLSAGNSKFYRFTNTFDPVTIEENI
jgi:hypothetical protein